MQVAYSTTGRESVDVFSSRYNNEDIYTLEGFSGSVGFRIILTRCIKCYKIAGSLLRPLPDKQTDETGPIHWIERE